MKLSEVIRDWDTRYKGNPEAEAIAARYDNGSIGITEAVLSLAVVNSLQWWSRLQASK